MQWPWSDLLLSGKKSIETRTYPLPSKYLGVELALIETPGLRGKKEAGIVKARVVGTITFGDSFQYRSAKHWANDKNRHLVDVGDLQFSWEMRKKNVWGWTVTNVRLFEEPVPAPKKRGIVFASACKIPGT